MEKSDGGATSPLQHGVMFDNLTPEKIEILKHWIRINGGFWETLCECGADTFNVGSMVYVPSPSGHYKERKSPTGLAHCKSSGCDKNIIVHKWHDNFPGYTPKPICRECGQDLPGKT